MADNTPFDNVFRTLLEKCTKLIIPVINEVFGTAYDFDEKITLLSNELYSKTDEGSLEKRVTDSCILLGDRLYHIECQSNPDSIMEIRMVEYDFQIAMKHREQRDGEQILRFPHSAALYLRHTSHTPDELKVHLILPDDSETFYKVPVVKVQEYSKKDIIDKELYFFVPYYIMKFEKELERIDQDKTEVAKLAADYKDIYQQLKKLHENRKVDMQYLYDLNGLVNYLMNIVAGRENNIRKEVGTMGGVVLDTEKLVIDQVKEQIREEGGFQKVLVMEEKGYPEEEACDILDVDIEAYRAFKEQNSDKIKQ